MERWASVNVLGHIVSLKQHEKDTLMMQINMLQETKKLDRHQVLPVDVEKKLVQDVLDLVKVPASAGSQRGARATTANACIYASSSAVHEQATGGIQQPHHQATSLQTVHLPTIKIMQKRTNGCTENYTYDHGYQATMQL
ncbi:hypothetical protein PoB_002358000 [Plakobranchus ocellatus]|uniref:Uncharacterized protein n=1 Tax=Plakobranchus ocellatus TaxID=259542 RepID=A0AAV3ZR54_9GAST|nr:hypothetical protein PoB_002358000 [Plakobranchus ocellatus]